MIELPFGKPQRRTERVSQAALEVVVLDSSDSFDSIRKLLLKWLEMKVGHTLPPAMARGETDSLDDVDALRTETVGLSKPVFWSFRRNDHDAEFPQRTWVTECSLARDGSRLRFGYRLHLINRGESAPFQRSIPRFMREIGSLYTVQIDGRDIDLEASRVKFEEEVDELVKLIESERRTLPIVCISSYLDIRGNDVYPLQADKIARFVFGTAHVFTITSKCSFLLTGRLGKHFSAYRGAARIWPADRYSSSQEAIDSPIFLLDRIIDDGADRVQRTIINYLLRASAQRRDSDQIIPSFSTVRQVASTLGRQQALQAGSSAEEMLSIYEADNRRLTEQVSEIRAEHEELLEVSEDETNSALVERDEARAEIRVLNNRLSVLQGMLRSHVQDATVPIPDDFSDIEEWSSKYLDNYIVLAPRAYRSARKSLFENPPLAYQALLLMKNFYVPMRRTGSSGNRSDWEIGLQQLGLSLTPTFASAGSGQFGDEYFLEWEGRKRELDLHLKGSNSREPRYGFRLYFFWCDRTRRVIVGSLPSHLSSRLT